ncbi:MAG: hypothetical protein AAGK66_07350 [Pseudomonadota bacterium]
MHIPQNSGGDFTPTPAGQHLGVLTRLIDLGTQPGSQMYPQPKRKILMGWEIPAQRVQYEKDGQQHEGPVLHYERMTFSGNSKALFRQRLEMWRGRPFTEQELAEFDMKSMLMVGATIQIAHTVKGDKTYADMQAILAPPKEQWPQPEGQVIYVSLEPNRFDQDAYSALSDKLKATIAQSPEYKAMFGEGQVQPTQQSAPHAAAQTNGHTPPPQGNYAPHAQPATPVSGNAQGWDEQLGDTIPF